MTSWQAKRERGKENKKKGKPKGKKQVVDDTNALEMTDQTKKKTRLSTGSEGSHHSRDSTQMPSDWAKHLTEDGKSALKRKKV